ncbi:hypothetical protein [Botrimarina hoheduenensis]|uniref:Uncharacterized protein n=1 Tax=Botrimarina hoheduenensis TaxID=2528000 RepID=A0A5C5WCJ3_9BACT|nr:hypothetical protein [Botrimarina hoheduenensis]TWT48638.1 hypothetical protein Pla111_04130 [Botrimarina hoheduenensis]
MTGKQLIATAFGLFLAVTQLGCNACQSCHDYGSPVSGATCGACNHARAGSYPMAGEPLTRPGVEVAERPKTVR